jgi:hypothetical protein
VRVGGGQTAISCITEEKSHVLIFPEQLRHRGAQFAIVGCLRAGGGACHPSLLIGRSARFIPHSGRSPLPTAGGGGIPIPQFAIVARHRAEGGACRAPLLIGLSCHLHPPQFAIVGCLRAGGGACHPSLLIGLTVSFIPRSGRSPLPTAGGGGIPSPRHASHGGKEAKGIPTRQ